MGNFRTILHRLLNGYGSQCCNRYCLSKPWISVARARNLGVKGKTWKRGKHCRFPRSGPPLCSAIDFPTAHLHSHMVDPVFGCRTVHLDVFKISPLGGWASVLPMYSKSEQFVRPPVNSLPFYGPRPSVARFWTPSAISE